MRMEVEASRQLHKRQVPGVLGMRHSLGEGRFPSLPVKLEGAPGGLGTILNGLSAVRSQFKRPSSSGRVHCLPTLDPGR
jgi:hypothetical protein